MVQFKQYIDKKTNNKKWLWSGYVGTDPITYKKVVSSKKGFDTKRQAQADFKNKQLELYNKKINVSNITINELLNLFIENKKDVLKSITIANYYNELKSMYEHKIINPNKKINSFTVIDCQNIFNKLKAKYKAPKNYLQTLKALFNYAVKNELIECNNFSKVDTTQKQINTVKPVNAFDLCDFKAFSNAISKLDLMYYVALHTLVYTGMRQGELRALYWSDIDLNNQTISINKTITKDVNYKDMIGDTPKNKSSQRVIAIDNKTTELLRKWKIKQAQDKLLQGIAINNDLVFHNRFYNVLSAVSLKYKLDKVCELAKIKRITVHGLRHTYVRLAIESNVPLIDIAKNVGHSNLNMIMQVYDDITENRQRNAVLKFSEYVSNN